MKIDEKIEVTFKRYSLVSQNITKDTSIVTWIHLAGTDQGCVSNDNSLLVVDFIAMINTLVIPTTVWMGMTIANQVFSDAKSCRVAVKEVLMFTSNTVRSGCDTGTLTIVWISDHINVLLRRPPILQIVTLVTPCPFTIRAPYFPIRIKELGIVLTAGCVDRENLI